MIRSATEDDYFNVSRLVQEHFHSSLLQDPFTNILIMGEENLEAFLVFSLMYERAEICYLFVDKNVRRRKLASQLLEKMFEIGKNSGIESFSLEVNVSNIEAIAFYEKFGFQKQTKRVGYYNGEDAYLMVKDMMK